MRKAKYYLLGLFVTGLAYLFFSGKAVGYLVWHEQHRALRMLLAMGAPHSREYIPAYTPLGIATEFGDLEAIRILTAAGASPNYPEPFIAPVTVAVNMYDTEILRALLDGGGNPNMAAGPVNRSLLMMAAAAGDVGKVRLLIERGADIYYRDTEGVSALDLVTKSPSDLPQDKEGWYQRPDFRNAEIANIISLEIQRNK